MQIHNTLWENYQNDIYCKGTIKNVFSKKNLTCHSYCVLMGLIASKLNLQQKYIVLKLKDLGFRHACLKITYNGKDYIFDIRFPRVKSKLKEDYIPLYSFKSPTGHHIDFVLTQLLNQNKIKRTYELLTKFSHTDEPVLNFWKIFLKRMQGLSLSEKDKQTVERLKISMKNTPHAKFLPYLPNPNYIPFIRSLYKKGLPGFAYGVKPIKTKNKKR